VAPLLARTGPDGAVWVLDWYNYLFLHNPALPGGQCEVGYPDRGCAWNNHLRVKERSRVYRVLPATGTPETVLNLSNATVPQLVAALSNPNFTWRLHAQRQLIARGFTEEMGTLLEKVLKNTWKDAVGNDPAVTHAVWVLAGLGELGRSPTRWNPLLDDLLKHPAWMTRRNVLMAMPRNAASAKIVNDNCSVNDPHAHVRLQALVALSETSSKPAEMKPMYDTYYTLDAHATSAATAAGITSSPTKTCEPTLHTVGTAPRAERALPRSDLRFALVREGFRLLPHGQLPSGEITVYAPDGRAAFRSAYRSREAQWSHTEARGLNAGIYLYVFRGVDGSLIQGSLSLITNL
jgi:hypothetical protein